MQPGFQLTSDKVFRSPYDEFAFTVDLTWPQYERSSTSSVKSGRERRDGLTMRKKERLDPVSYDDDDVTLSWDDIEVNSVLRAQVYSQHLPCLFLLNAVGIHDCLQG